MHRWLGSFWRRSTLQVTLHAQLLACRSRRKVSRFLFCCCSISDISSFTTCQHDKQSSLEVKFSCNRGRAGGERHVSIGARTLCQKRHPGGKRDSRNLHLDYGGNRKTTVMNLVLKKRLMRLYFEWKCKVKHSDALWRIHYMSFHTDSPPPWLNSSS